MTPTCFGHNLTIFMEYKNSYNEVATIFFFRWCGGMRFCPCALLMLLQWVVLFLSYGLALRTAMSAYSRTEGYGHLILSTHLRLGLPCGLLPAGFPTKTLYTPSPHPYAPHTQPISFFSILSPAQYWVRSTSHLASLYAVSSILPLPRPS